MWLVSHLLTYKLTFMGSIAITQAFGKSQRNSVREYDGDWIVATLCLVLII